VLETGRVTNRTNYDIIPEIFCNLSLDNLHFSPPNTDTIVRHPPSFVVGTVKNLEYLYSHRCIRNTVAIKVPGGVSELCELSKI